MGVINGRRRIRYLGPIFFTRGHYQNDNQFTFLLLCSRFTFVVAVWHQNKNWRQKRQVHVSNVTPLRWHQGVVMFLNQGCYMMITTWLLPWPHLGVNVHKDVIKSKHFPRYWPFVQGIHRSRWIPVQRPVTRSFDVLFALRLNKRLSKQSWGLWFEPQSCPL